jgi:hypothetical protein
LDTVSAYPFITDAYIVVKDLCDSGGIGGWEGQLAWDQGIYITGMDLRGQGLNIGTFPDLVVGLESPLPADSVIVIADIHVIATGPGGIYLKPSSRPMIVGAESPIFVFGSNPQLFALMSYAFGDSGSVCASIGAVPCPVENEYSSSLPDTIANELSSQYIVVTRPNAIYLPDRDGVFTFSELAFSSPELRSIFETNDVQWAQRVFPRQLARQFRDSDGVFVPLIGGNEAIIIGIEGHERQDGIIEGLQELPDILSLEPNGVVQELSSANTDPDDPAYESGLQWGLNGASGVKANVAWDTTTGEQAHGI